MSIKIKSLARINPRDMAAPKKFYATAVNQGDLSLKNLSKQIALMSTVSRTDVYAVLMAFIEVVPAALEDGKIVRLGSLGTLRVVVSSESADTAEEVSSHSVKQLKLRYRPSAELKTQIKAFPIEKV